LSVKLFIIPITPPKKDLISTISIGVNPVSLRYSPPAEKGPVSAPLCVGALFAEGSEGLEGRRPVRILARRMCLSERRRECSSEGEARSEAALHRGEGNQSRYISINSRRRNLHIEKDLADFDKMPWKGYERFRILLFCLHQLFQVLCCVSENSSRYKAHCGCDVIVEQLTDGQPFWTDDPALLLALQGQCQP
jgi:hypothetical protein